MRGLNVYTSNRMEVLVEHLAQVVAKPLSSPFVSEVIVVQSRGMERWLSMKLAAELGVWANCRFPFPNRFTWEVFKAVLGNVPDLELLSPEVNAWRIVKILPECLAREGFESLRMYLSGAQLNLKSLQLAERIADAFDKYAVYRPEQVLGWDRGIENHWQAQFWRFLHQGERSAHRARIWREALRRLSAQGEIHDADKAPDPQIGGVLPERVSIFGIPALPRYHIEVLKSLADRIPVHLFLFNPSREYWADIVPERKIVSLERIEQEKSSPATDLHFDVGNPLLASFGRLGRDFFRAVIDLQPEPLSGFVDPGEDSLLASIQSDILTLRNRGESEAKTIIDPADRSLEIHSCHGPWREIEVLYDRLLNLFESNRDLTPKDIVVMTPDIEAYAPYITAVFDACQDERKRIPYSVADRRVPSESLVVDLFFKIVDLYKSRLQASQVVDILSAGIVRRKFDISAEDMDLIRRWIIETNIRWGIDAEQRAALGLPAFDGNSWSAGMERLILGYSLKGDDEELFLGRLPYDVEGEEAATLGRLLQFLKQLFSTVQTLNTPRTLTAWAGTFESLIETFIVEDDETAEDTQRLRDEFEALKAVQKMSGFDGIVEIEVVRYYLSTRFRSEQLSRGFMTGGVTFCEMLPMRSIPFRIVCLIGLNNEAYPREESPVAFDLIAQNPEAGDRSLRDEDRYLFLEALLSARDFFYISYVGQSVRDNSVIPPSVLVSELLDYCDQGFSPAGERAGSFLVTDHRLQAFSPSYFASGGALFSYSQEDFDTALARLNPYRRSDGFIQQLSEPPDEWKQVSTEDLKRFYQNPARYLLRYRLGLYLEESERVLRGEEPFALDGLDAYNLGELMIRSALQGKELKQYLAVARAQGILPPGVPGDLAFSNLKNRIEAFSEGIKPHVSMPLLVPIDVDLTIAGFRLSGRVDNVRPSGIVTFRFAKDKGRHQVGAWIDHLILNIAGEQGYPRISRMITTDRSLVFQPLEDAEAIMESLLGWYWRGLAEPLRFFPEASLSFAEHVKKGDEISDAIKAAQSVWEGSEFAPGPRGEGEDPYFNLCFRNTDPFVRPFDEVAAMFFDTLLEHRESAR